MGTLGSWATIVTIINALCVCHLCNGCAVYIACLLVVYVISLRACYMCMMGGVSILHAYM